MALAMPALFAGALLAQRHQLVYNPDSPEGQLLELIELQSDQAKRTTLLRTFLDRYPRHPAMGWVGEQLQEAYVQTQQHDLVIEAGERLLAVYPEGLEAAQLCLAAARARKEPVQIRLWSDLVARIAERIAASPPPKDSELIEAWKLRVQNASQITAHDEFAIYTQAANSPDPKTRLQFLDELTRKNPSSPYMPQAQILYLQTYRVLGNQPQALAAAGKILETDPNNEDALLTVAETLLARGGSTDRVLGDSRKILALMQSKQKPAIVSEHEWEKKKALYAGTAHWMIGNIAINQKRFSEADRELRSALPLLRGSAQSAAAILFYLGWANYQMENYTEAARFYNQCAAISSQYQGNARRNLDVLKNDHKVTP